MVNGEFHATASTDSQPCVTYDVGLKAGVALVAKAWIDLPFGGKLEGVARAPLAETKDRIRYVPKFALPAGCDAPPASTDAPSTTAGDPATIDTASDGDDGSDQDQEQHQDGSTSSATRTIKSVFTTPDLNCGLLSNEDAHAEYYDDTACGTFVAVNGSLYRPATVPAGQSLSTVVSPRAWTPVSQALTGGGTVANPCVRVTVVAADSTGVQVTQRESWVDGGSVVTTTITVANATSSPLSLRVYHAFDCYLANEDDGTTEVSPAAGSASCLGADMSGAPLALRLTATTAGATVAALPYSRIWRQIGSLGDLSNTSASGDIDNGAGIAWSLNVPARSQVVLGATTSVGAR